MHHAIRRSAKTAQAATRETKWVLAHVDPGGTEPTERGGDSVSAELRGEGVGERAHPQGTDTTQIQQPVYQGGAAEAQ